MSAPPAFPHRLAGHCGSGALRDLLELHELDYGAGPLSEGFAFGLGGGVGFLYVELPGAPTPAYLVGRTADLETDIARSLEIEIDIRETDDPAEGWAWVREEVDAGRPPMVWADIAELEYLRVRMTNTRHDIVVAGYDEDERIAWIADNDREELQRCSYDSLARARSSQGFPGPNHHRVFVYHWPQQLRDARDAVRTAIEITLDNMTGGGSQLGQLAGHAGLAGVDAFCEAYPLWPERFDGEMKAALNGLSVLITKAGTGGALFRSLQASFLHDAAALLDAPALASAAERYDELTAAWIELAAAAREHDHAAGVPIASSIGPLEHEATAALQSAYVAL